MVKLRSFSKAAEALYLTQPTVSGHVKNLETELGVKLIDRIGKRVVPTEAGEILFQCGQKLLLLRDQTRQEIENISGVVTGLLRVGASTIPGAYIIPGYISSFKKKYPTVKIQLLINDSARVVELVLKGELHIGIVGAPTTNPCLESYSFLKDELVLAVPTTHPWAKKKSIGIDTVAGQPFIMREKGSGTRHIMEEQFEKAGIPPHALNIVAIAGSSDAIRQSVKAGLGISIISICALHEDIKYNSLAAVRIKGIPLVRNFYIVLLKGKSRSPLCHVFLDALLGKKNR